MNGNDASAERLKDAVRQIDGLLKGHQDSAQGSPSSADGEPDTREKLPPSHEALVDSSFDSLHSSDPTQPIPSRSVWFYQHASKNIGPVSEEVISQLIAAAVLNQVNLVWQEGMETWMPLAATQLAVHLAQNAPPCACWYYQHDSTQIGPVSEEVLCQLLAAEILNPSSLVWRDGMEHWMELSTSPLALHISRDAVTSTKQPIDPELTGPPFPDPEEILVHINPGHQLYEQLSINEANRKLAAGELNGDVPAWITGLSEWTTLDKIPGIALPKQSSAPGYQPSLQDRLHAENTASPALPPHDHNIIPERFAAHQISGLRRFCLAAHPQAWRRFWARIIDIGIARVCLEFLAIVVFISTEISPPYERHPVPAFVGTFVVWVVFLILFEAFFIAAISTTVGKALFRIQVLHESGRRLSFSEALSRAHDAIWHGTLYLIGFPGITLFAIYRSYRNMLRDGRASWDTAIGSVVRCRRVPGILYVFGVALAITSLVGYTLVREYAKQEGKKALRQQWNR